MFSTRGFFRFLHPTRRRREASVPPPVEEKRCTLMNMIGEAITPLAVYGFIEIAGIQYEARSNRFVYIHKGSRIRVTGQENFAYLVEVE